MTSLLAIETSAEACSVALDVGGEIREKFEHAPMRHAEILLPAIHALLAEADMPLSRLDAIAFGRGPGSFTSLRIGIGVVQGLAWGADLPVVPVSSLAAVAQQAIDFAGGKRPVCVAMDARMQEVFSCHFRADGNGLARAIDEERVCSPAAVQITAGEAFIAAGNGFERYPELAAAAGRADQCFSGIWPRAATVIHLAKDWLSGHEALPAMQAQPVYVRNKVADKPS